MKAFFEKYPYIKQVIIFFVIYMIFFLALEQRNSRIYWTTDSWIDQYIPFNEYFVIPYLLWFVYIAFGFIYFIFVDQSGFQRTCFYLFTGMAVSLLLYFIFPNQQSLRVELSNTNIFQCLISFIYSVDSPTNVCPSLHVYNSLMMMLTLQKSQHFQKRKWLSIINIFLSIIICISTVMIKQHAFIDVIFAIILAIIVYHIGKWKFNY